MSTWTYREFMTALYEAAGRRVGRAVDAAEVARDRGIPIDQAGFALLLFERMGVLRRASEQGETMDVLITEMGAAYVGDQQQP